MKTFYLRELAHARAGDKGNTSNIGVIAYEPQYFPIILRHVTAQRVKAHFGSIATGPVTRHVLPNLDAMNFVLEGALGGGVTRSLSLDPHGKSYSALILSMRVDVPDDIAAELMLKGRRPVAEPQEEAKS